MSTPKERTRNIRNMTYVEWLEYIEDHSQEIPCPFFGHSEGMYWGAECYGGRYPNKGLRRYYEYQHLAPQSPNTVMCRSQWAFCPLIERISAEKLMFTSSPKSPQKVKTAPVREIDLGDHLKTFIVHSWLQLERIALADRTRRVVAHLSGIYPNKFMVQRIFSAYLNVTLKVPRCIYERIARASRSYVEILELPRGRRSFWTERLRDQVRYLRRECAFSAEEICKSLYCWGIRVTKRAVIRFLMRTRLPPPV